MGTRTPVDLPEFELSLQMWVLQHSSSCQYSALQHTYNRLYAAESFFGTYTWRAAPLFRPRFGVIAPTARPNCSNNKIVQG